MDKAIIKISKDPLNNIPTFITHIIKPKRRLGDINFRELRLALDIIEPELIQRWIDKNPLLSSLPDKVIKKRVYYESIVQDLMKEFNMWYPIWAIKVALATRKIYKKK